MHITIGGTITLLGMLVVWVFASAVASDPGCSVIENAEYMAGPAKAFSKFFLLCWLF